MIDRQKFDNTFLQFDKETVVEIIDIFLSEHDERFAKLRKNVAERDFDQLKFTAHNLKGVIANFMDPVTINLATKLDEMTRNHTEVGIDQVFEELESNTILLIEEMKKIRQEFIS
jgi:HPt (histidine-containing phosphotransfer) domain-containing protein